MVARLLVVVLLGVGAKAAEKPTVGALLKFEHKPSSWALKQLQESVEEIFRPSDLDLRWLVLDGQAQPDGGPGSRRAPERL